jgi:hypothetical protein
MSVQVNGAQFIDDNVFIFMDDGTYLTYDESQKLDWNSFNGVYESFSKIVELNPVTIGQDWMVVRNFNYDYLLTNTCNVSVIMDGTTFNFTSKSGSGFQNKQVGGIRNRCRRVSARFASSSDDFEIYSLQFSIGPAVNKKLLRT